MTLAPNTSYEDETFKSLNAKEINLKKSIFNHVVFEQCNFTESDWQGAELCDCQFKNCNLSLINLTGSKLQDTTFEECKIVGVDFYKCEKFIHIKFIKSILQTCNFTDLKLKKISFKGSRIKEVYFANTELVETDFTDTDLAGTIFHRCDLTKSDFRNAKNYIIDLQANNLKKAKFSFPEAINLLKCLDIEIS